MSNSVFTPGYAQYRKVGSGGATSAAGTGLQPFSADLSTELTTKEHVIIVHVSQARTTPAVSCDVRKVFKSIALNLSGGPNSGDRFSMSGQIADLMSRLTENQPSPEIDLTNGTADFIIDLHHLLHGSHLDMVSAIRMGLYSGAKLNFVLNGTTNQLFTGGTAAGDVVVTVEVKAKDYQQILELENYEKIATFSHHTVGRNFNVVGTGEQVDISIDCGKRRNRFIALAAYDAAGALSDAIVSDIKLTVGSHVSEFTFKELRRATAGKRGVDLTGIVVIDMGDNPSNFTPANVAKATLAWSALAAGRLEVAADWIEPLVY